MTSGLSDSPSPPLIEKTPKSHALSIFGVSLESWRDHDQPAEFRVQEGRRQMGSQGIAGILELPNARLMDVIVMYRNCPI